MKTISKNTLHKNFILIHEFLHPTEPIKGWVREDKDYTGHYHDNFEVLMDVIVKCEGIDSIQLRNQIEPIHFYKGNILEIYKGVVEFIKNHNPTKNTEQLNQNILQALKNALADLEGIMPEFEPSGDRKHSGWKTIKELKKAIKDCSPKHRKAK